MISSRSTRFWFCALKMNSRVGKERLENQGCPFRVTSVSEEPHSPPRGPVPTITSGVETTACAVSKSHRRRAQMTAFLWPGRMGHSSARLNLTWHRFEERQKIPNLVPRGKETILEWNPATVLTNPAIPNSAGSRFRSSGTWGNNARSASSYRCWVSSCKVNESGART